MTTLKPPFRRARIDDAAVLAELVNYAGEGMPLYQWDLMAAHGQSAWEVGIARASRAEGSFSYRNAIIVEHERQLAGCLIGYEIPDVVEPVPQDIPAMFRPLQELENQAPGTWYVNVLAVLPERRRHGLGTALLGLAEHLGRTSGKRGMSVIVSDANTSARRLYERCGYRETAQRPMVKNGWSNESENWILMTKDL